MKKLIKGKRPLICSILSLVLCMAMLIGTTMAWFTDTATASVNQIKSGTFDVDIIDTEGNSIDGGVLSFVGMNENSLWEPGCTYQLTPFKVANNGDLALKYKLTIGGISGDEKLNDVIEWTVNGQPIEDLTDTLEAGESSGEFIITGHMQESASNEYQNLSITNIVISVIAYQETSESDSFDSQYDANANGYPDNPTVTTSTKKEITTDTETVFTTVGNTPAGTGETSVVFEANAIDAGNGTLTVSTASEDESNANFEVVNGMSPVAKIDLALTVDGTEVSNFNGTATITTYVQKNLPSATVYYDGTAMPTTYDANTGKLTFTTNHFSEYVVMTTPITFDAEAKTANIYTEAGLRNFGENVSSYEGYTVNLMNDIDMSNTPWTPLNVNSITIDGNNHSINNMKISSSHTFGYGSGFIGNATGEVTIKNVTFKNADVSTNGLHVYVGNIVGTVMGYAYGTTVFDNVSVLNSNIWGYGKVGGLLGMGAKAGVSITFNNCISQGNNIHACYDVGGLAGNIQRSSTGIDNASISNCTVNNTWVRYSGATYVELNTTVKCASNEANVCCLGDGHAVTGLFWKDDTNYYWPGYAEGYCSYGKSSHDCELNDITGYLANSEYMVNVD